MKYIYRVSHRNPENDDIKLLGHCSTLQKAQEIIARHKTYKGFKRSPDNFWIDTYELDKRYWQEGYYKKSTH